MRKIIKFFIDNAKVFNTFAVALICFGLYIFIWGKKEGFPNIKIDQIFINTIYPGASAEEVERIITAKFEDEIKRVNGIKRVTSQSVESLSTVILELDADQSKNSEKIFADVKNAIDRVTGLPDSVKKPDVFQLDFDLFPAITIIVVGSNEVALRESARRIENAVKNLPGVGKVNREGYRDREIWVEVDPARLAAYQLTMADVITSIRLRNLNLPGGKIQITGREYLLRTIGQFKDLDQVAGTVVRANVDGNTVRVADVGRVRWDFEEARQITRADGEVGIRLKILKKKSGDIIKVADSVKVVIDRFNKEKTLGADTRLFFADDQSFYVKNRLRVLSENAFFGLILVVICLILFFDGITTFWATAGVPIVFCTSLVYLNFVGTTLNLMSMFGFIIVVGLLVDDAVVVAENIFRHREMGKEPMKATLDGASEVFVPVTATTLTTILAFLPLLLLPGIFGKFLGIIPIVVTVCMLLSLLETFAFLPGRLVNSLQAIGAGSHGAPVKGWRSMLRQGLLTGFFTRMTQSYRTVLRRIMTPKWGPLTTLILISALSLVLLGVGFTLVKKEFFSGSTDEFLVALDLESSTPIEGTARVVDDAEHRVKGALSNVIREVIATAGFQESTTGNSRQRPYVGGLRVIMVPNHPLKNADVIGKIEKEMKQIPGLASFKVTGRRGGPPVQAPVAIKIFGDDLENLRGLSAKVAKDLEGISNTVSVSSSFEADKEEYVLRVNEGAAAMYGVNVNAAAFALRNAFNGGEASVANSIPGEEKEVTIRVRYNQNTHMSLEDLSRITTKNMQGLEIPLRSFAEVTKGKSITVINREDGERVVTVSSDLRNAQDRKYNSQAINGMLEPRIKELLAPYPTYHYKMGGEEEDRKELMVGAGIALLVSLLGIYVLLLALFRSFIQPVIVMFVVPYSIVGVIMGLWISGVPFGLTPIIGTVALIGIIVKSTIIMVSFINNLRARGRSRIDAIIEGSATRLRPILATSITGVVGLLPLAYGLGGKEPFLQPMGLALAWGLSFGTVITLVILPCFYMVLDTFVEWSVTKMGFTYKLPFDMEGGSDEADQTHAHAGAVEKT